MVAGHGQIQWLKFSGAALVHFNRRNAPGTSLYLHWPQASVGSETPQTFETLSCLSLWAPPEAVADATSRPDAIHGAGLTDGKCAEDPCSRKTGCPE